MMTTTMMTRPYLIHRILEEYTYFASCTRIIPIRPTSMQPQLLLFLLTVVVAAIAVVPFAHALQVEEELPIICASEKDAQVLLLELCRRDRACSLLYNAESGTDEFMGLIQYAGLIESTQSAHHRRDQLELLHGLWRNLPSLLNRYRPIQIEQQHHGAVVAATTTTAEKNTTACHEDVAYILETRPLFSITSLYIMTMHRSLINTRSVSCAWPTQRRITNIETGEVKCLCPDGRVDCQIIAGQGDWHTLTGLAITLIVLVLVGILLHISRSAKLFELATQLLRVPVPTAAAPTTTTTTPGLPQQQRLQRGQVFGTESALARPPNVNVHGR